MIWFKKKTTKEKKETPSAKTQSPKKTPMYKKLLTAEGWKRLMMKKMGKKSK